jgi:hypothetical protein
MFLPLCLRSHDLDNKCSPPADDTKRSRGTLGIYLKFISSTILHDAAYKRYFYLWYQEGLFRLVREELSSDVLTGQSNWNVFNRYYIECVTAEYEKHDTELWL